MTSTESDSEEIHTHETLEIQKQEILQDSIQLKSQILSESLKLSQYNLTADFSESIKVLYDFEKLLKYKKYHSQLIILKSIINDLSIADTLEIKDALLLYKDISLRKLNLDEFSLEIREFIQKSTDSIKQKAQTVLENDFKRAGWYNGPLLALESDILQVLLEIEFKSKPNIVAQVLLKEPLTAFKFHFSGNRPTNRVDRPQWQFRFVLGVLENTHEWVKTEVGPGQGVDVFDDLILGWQMELMRKFKREISESLTVMHLVQEILNFDNKLKNTFGTKRSLLGMVFSDDVFLEIWTSHKLKETLEKIKGWISQENAWERDLTSDSVVCCTMMVGLINSITDFFEFLKLDQKRYFFNEIFLVLLESYKDSIQEFVNKMKIIFKPIKSEIASLSSACERLSILAGYHLGLVQVNQWLDIWANDMTLSLEIDDDENVFDKISHGFITMQLEMEQMLYDEFSILFENAIYDYKYEKKAYSDLEILAPKFTSVCLIVDSIFEVLEKNWSQLAFKRIRNKVIGIIEKDLNSCSVRRYDLVHGLLPIISKRGASVEFNHEKFQLIL